LVKHIKKKERKEEKKKKEKKKKKDRRKTEEEIFFFLSTYTYFNDTVETIIRVSNNFLFFCACSTKK
jgi:superfamily I DNA and/or RNA helicase